MKLCPETFPIRLGSKPVGGSTLADTCDWIHLENADGVLITILHTGNTGGSMICTVHQGTAGSGTLALAAESGSTPGGEFEIWINTDCATSDTMVKQTNAVTYTIVPAATDQMVCFYVRAANLTPGYKWVQLGTASGHNSNTAAVIYQLSGGRYQQTTPPTDIA